MTLGHGQSGKGSGGNGRAGGVASLGDVDLSVPASPGLVRVEHATTAAHVAEGGGARARSTTTADTGDTGNGATGTPGFGRCLFAGDGRNGIGLAVVLIQTSVDLSNDIGTNWGFENGRQIDLSTGCFTVFSIN